MWKCGGVKIAEILSGGDKLALDIMVKVDECGDALALYGVGGRCGVDIGFLGWEMVWGRAAGWRTDSGWCCLWWGGVSVWLFVYTVA